MIDRLFDSKKIIHKALDASWTRNEAIAQNIANIDTPGYKRKTVSFEEQLRDAMDKNDFKKSDIDKLEIKVVEENKSLKQRLDGNNVDIDMEMSELAKNSIRYSVLSQVAGFQKLRMVIKEGK